MNSEAGEKRREEYSRFWASCYAHDVVSACFELILYVRSERRQRFDESTDSKLIAETNANDAIDDEASEQLTANFFQV